MEIILNSYVYVSLHLFLYLDVRRQYRVSLHIDIRLNTHHKALTFILINFFFF